MAKAQKRRGDMLEDEVTDRFRQLQRQEKTYRELLAQLPQGIILASVNGRHMPKNPAAESWLAEDAISEGRPISDFLEGLVNGNGGPLEKYVELGGRKLRLRASALGPQDEGVERVVLIEELGQGAPPDVASRLGGRRGPSGAGPLAVTLRAEQLPRPRCPAGHDRAAARVGNGLQDAGSDPGTVGLPRFPLGLISPICDPNTPPRPDPNRRHRTPQPSR